MDILCLWVGRIVLMSFGLAGAVWFAFQPVEWAYRTIPDKFAFWKAYRRYKSEQNDDRKSWRLPKNPRPPTKK